MTINSNETFIIAEAGVNHNGSIEKAKQLIRCAAESGADAVKFQTFKAEKVASNNTPKAAYQKETTDPRESQLKMLKKLELDRKAHSILIEESRKSNIIFLSTPFDNESLDLLTDTFDIKYIKIPSGEITNLPFLLKIARKGKQVILSTGMSTLGEIELALGTLAFGYLNHNDAPSLGAFNKTYGSKEGLKILRDKITLLHCTSSYPASLNEVNLKAMDTMRQAFDLNVGYSDHTEGIVVAIAAVARGASVIEKHFTLDKNLPGPDHKASLEPDELKTMINSIRQVEKTLGSFCKTPSFSEIKNIPIARKSLVASLPIKAGEMLTEKNVIAKRPGDGISPTRYWEIIGQINKSDLDKDETIK